MSERGMNEEGGVKRNLSTKGGIIPEIFARSGVLGPRCNCTFTLYNARRGPLAHIGSPDRLAPRFEGVTE